MTSLYNLTIPVMTRALNTQVKVLKLGEEWAKENGMPIAELASARLHDDMFTLSKQIATSTMWSKKAVQDLVGIEVDNHELKEYSIDECHKLLSDTLALLAEVKPETLDAKASDGPLEFKAGPMKCKSTNADYVQRVVMPTVYFHVITMYDILRMKGVPLGKRLFLAEFFAGGVDVTM
ncbi:hypothetical protein GGR52DRAFT_527766 [Hypoxylon sp. FL1284]|nr:hypothetical protein GGR52DRAFT_527766 [Hypoxylon sp. FL1284]